MEEEDGEESKKKNRRKRKTPLKVETAPQWQSSSIEPADDRPEGLDDEGSFLETRLSNSLPRHHCPVCGDRANGLHYGIYTCEGCKNFFKRSIVATQERPYFCKFNNDCDISVFDPDGVKRNRLRCQSCRYQACVDAGMYHSGSLQPRVGRPRKSSRLEGHAQAEGVPLEVSNDHEVRDLQYEVDLLRSKNRELTTSLKERDNQLALCEKQISNLKSQISALRDIDRRLMNDGDDNNGASSPPSPLTNGRSGLFKDGNVTITPILPGKAGPKFSSSAVEIKEEVLEEEEEDMATIEAVSSNSEAQPATTIKKWKINSYNNIAD